MDFQASSLQTYEYFCVAGDGVLMEFLCLLAQQASHAKPATLNQ